MNAFFTLAIAGCWLHSCAQPDPIALFDSETINVGSTLVLEDVDQDGSPELITPGIGVLYVFDVAEYGTNAWTPLELPSNAAYAPLNLQAADINQDGYSDLVTVDYADIQILYMGDDYSYTQVTIPGTFNGLAQEFAMGDLDGDGDLDFAVAAYNEMYWIENLNNNDLWEVHDFPVDPSTTPVLSTTFVDWNNDGMLDLLVFPLFPGNASMVYLQEDPDTWDPVILNPESSGGFSVEIADYDNDGTDELIYAGWSRVEWMDVGGNNLQTVLASTTNPEGGQLYDVDDDGQLEWMQAIWPDGDFSWVDQDENTDFFNPELTGITVPGTHDFLFFDGDGNGTDDLFFVTYEGDITLGVFPDFSLDDDTSVAEREGHVPSWYVQDGRIHLDGALEQEDAAFFTPTGQLVRRTVVSGTNSVRIPDGLKGCFVLQVGERVKRFCGDGV